MAFTFSINGHTYTSDPTNTGVAAGYHFDGYNYMTALGNLCGDLVAVAAAVVSDKNTTAASAAASADSAGASASSASTATTQAGLATSNGAAQVALATTQANNSSASADAALASQNLSADWADKLTEVVAGRYSAKYWAGQAQASVTGQLIYRGGWDASGNTFPTAGATRDFYKITVAGTLGGYQVQPCDDIIYNGVGWDVIDNSEAPAASQAEMETGTEAALRMMSPLGVGQAIAAQANAAPLYRNANFNALAGKTYLVDTSAGAITATLPAAPALGDSITFIDVAGTFGEHNLTVARNGNNYLDETGTSVAEDLILDIAGISITQYYKSPNWRIA